MATLRTVTLGCKVNQYETEFVRQALTKAGYRDAADQESADLCVVNTCTVTAEGDSKSRQTIRQLARRNPGTRIVVMTARPGRIKQIVQVNLPRPRSLTRRPEAEMLERLDGLLVDEIKQAMATDLGAPATP